MNNLYEQYGLKTGVPLRKGVFTWTTIGSSDDVDMAEPDATTEAASSSHTG